MRTPIGYLAPCLLALPLAAQWGPVATSLAPAPRSEALLAYDVLNSRMLLFGGNYTNDFWALVGTTWTQLTPGTLPGPRRYANLASDPLGGQLWLYGGQDGGSVTALDETWRWDGVSWQLLAPSGGPGGLIRHAMAFDEARQICVTYGGRRDIFQPTQVLDETWVFAGNAWTLATPNGQPPPLLDAAMAYHPTLGQLILFGGIDPNGDGTDQTWLFDGLDWTRINQTGVIPPPRAGGKLVQVLNRGIVVLFGGRDPVTLDILNDTWEHDGMSWREVQNVYGGIYPPRAEVAIAHDFQRDRIVAFGGKTANQALRDDTWEYGAQWQPFGLACAGTAGTPLFRGVDLPQLGSVASATVDHVPPGIPFAFVAIGVSRTQWALGSLPTLLTSFGMPGCRNYTSADLFVAIPATAGVATWTWPVPLIPDFVGEALHLQGILFDPGANALGLVTANAATMVVGN